MLTACRHGTGDRDKHARAARGRGTRRVCGRAAREHRRGPETSPGGPLEAGADPWHRQRNRITDLECYSSEDFRDDSIFALD
jgi:hypothetical protein